MATQLELIEQEIEMVMGTNSRITHKMQVKKEMLQFLKEEIELLAVEQDTHNDELIILFDKKNALKQQIEQKTTTIS